jgi:hypothetical protein
MQHVSLRDCFKVFFIKVDSWIHQTVQNLHGTVIRSCLHFLLLVLIRVLFTHIRFTDFFQAVRLVRQVIGDHMPEFFRIFSSPRPSKIKTFSFLIIFLTKSITSNGCSDLESPPVFITVHS